MDVFSWLETELVGAEEPPFHFPPMTFRMRFKATSEIAFLNFYTFKNNTQAGLWDHFHVCTFKLMQFDLP